MFTDPTPVWGDEKPVLLAKICQIASTHISATHAPKPGDSENQLLFKLALIFSGN